MTKPTRYQGDPLNEERAERIAADTLAELDTMTDEEVATRIRPGVTRRARVGRPTLGEGQSGQLRIRVAADLLAELDAVARRTCRSRSTIVREALEEHLHR